MIKPNQRQDGDCRQIAVYSNQTSCMYVMFSARRDIPQGNWLSSSKQLLRSSRLHTYGSLFIIYYLPTAYKAAFTTYHGLSLRLIVLSSFYPLCTCRLGLHLSSSLLLALRPRTSHPSPTINLHPQNPVNHLHKSTNPPVSIIFFSTSTNALFKDVCLFVAWLPLFPTNLTYIVYLSLHYNLFRLQFVDVVYSAAAAVLYLPVFKSQCQSYSWTFDNVVFFPLY